MPEVSIGAIVFPDPKSIVTSRDFKLWCENLDRWDDEADALLDAIREFERQLCNRYKALQREPFTYCIETEYITDPPLSGTIVVVRLVRIYSEDLGEFIEQEHTFCSIEQCSPNVTQYIASLCQEYAGATTRTIDHRTPFDD